MWHQITIQCLKTEAEHCENYLLLAGAVSISFQDAKDQPIFEPALGTTPIWELTEILALFEQSVDMVSVKKFLKKHLSSAIYDSVKIEFLPEKDWIKESMKDWKPLCFGKKLWICPSWQSSDSATLSDSTTLEINSNTYPNQNIETRILLDPGLAFGTGTHPTTRLCLEWLDAHPPLKARIIDYGCGSGILGIAALKLGAEKVFAVDHDIQALKSTEMNAEKNDLTNKQIIALLPKDLNKKMDAVHKVDLILANILANPLIELASTFSTLLVANGQIVLSGILHDQKNQILEAYKPWFKDFDIESLDEWLRIVARLI